MAALLIAERTGNACIAANTSTKNRRNKNIKIGELIALLAMSIVVGLFGMLLGTIVSPIIQLILTGEVNKTGLLIFSSITGIVAGFATLKKLIDYTIQNAVEEALENN